VIRWQQLREFAMTLDLVPAVPDVLDGEIEIEARGRTDGPEGGSIIAFRVCLSSPVVFAGVL
jgi:hypothetical protein